MTTKDIIVFPNGGCTKVLTMATVNITDNGVAVLNARGDMVGWIEADNNNKKRRAADEVRAAMGAGKRFTQPDWSYLAEDDDEEEDDEN